MTNSRTATVSPRISATRRYLLLSCAFGAAFATAARPDEAKAQAFQAQPTTVSGSVTYSRATPGTETITVNSPSAIINWQPNNPNDNPIIFLPQGNTATFENGPNNSDFAVLNRIAATNPVRFDGTVISRLRDIAAGTSRPGGTVLFSSPGGIIIGATAVFDVGNLVMTTLNVDEIGYGGGEFITANGDISFSGGAANPNATIVTETGAQINAIAENSYVAFVAPRLEHGGSTRVNGSVAYIAGEQVQMRVDQGLFDIFVATGSDNATPIIHTGTTGGPASSGAGDRHAIYMVALPKNQAITMMLSGDVGFDAATDATVENGEIVLSAGQNVFAGELPEQSRPAGAPAADLSIVGGAWSSRVTGQATRNAIVSSTSGTISFASHLSLGGVEAARIDALNGGDVTVGGNVDLLSRGTADAAGNVTGGIAVIEGRDGSTIDITGNARVRATPIQNNGNATGGIARIISSAATVKIGGDAIVEALANTFDPSGTGGTATGGSAVIAAGGFSGTLTIGGDALVASYAFGRDGGFAGTGGSSLVSVGAGSTVDIAGALELNAQGLGGNNMSGSGGTGTGGNATILTASTTQPVVCSCPLGGTLNVGGHTLLNAGGQGGAGVGTGGAGIGGTARIDQLGGSIALSGSTALGADGFGGAGATGGNGSGGSAGVLAFGGQLTLSGPFFASARGFGGGALAGFGGRGGDGTGGEAFLQSMTDASGFGTIVGGDVFLDVSGSGGRGGDGDGSTIAPGVGGTGTGGAFTGQTGSGGAFALAQVGSSLTLASATLNSIGTGGAGGTGLGTQAGGAGGAGFGGTTQAGTFIGGADPATSTGGASLGGVALNSSATGGVGGGGEGGRGAGGAAEGGSAFLIARVRPVTVAGASLTAGALGGAGGTGGDAVGGTALALAAAGGALTVTDTLSVNAFGLGGAGPTDGAGTGGFAGIQATDGGTATIEAAIVTADGTGGSSTGGDGGDGAGGEAEISATGAGSSISIASVAPFLAGPVPNLLSASGAGGRNTGGGNLVGGTGTGGTATVLAEAGGSVTLPATGGDLGMIRVLARGQGGNAAAEGGQGGVGIGGVVEFVADGGTIVAGPLLPSTFAVGGSSGNGAANIAGGDAVGGRRSFTVTNGGFLSASTVGGSAGALGGNGSGTGNGGSAVGGAATVDVIDGRMELTGSFHVISQSDGGTGATGGAASGGSATVTVGQNGEIVGATADAALLLTAGGFGGDGSLVGGDGSGGSAQIILDGGAITLPAAGVFANGRGGSGGDSGGEGIGGDARILAANGGTATLSLVNVNADGTGGSSAGGDGGDGTGGDVEISATGAGSSITVSAFASDEESEALGSSGFLTAIGTGGQNNGGGDLTGGTGTGGSATILAEAGGMVTLPGDAGSPGLVSVRGIGGDAAAEGGTGGTGEGGTIEIGADGGVLIAGSLRPDAFGQGGSSADSSRNIVGGIGIGGNHIVFVRNDGRLVFLPVGGGSGTGGGRVLYRVDDAVGTDYLAQALAESGYDVTTTNGDLSEFDLSQFDLVIYANQNSGVPSGDIAKLTDFINGGGSVLFNNWLNEQPPLDATHSGTNNLTDLSLNQFDDGISANLIATNPGWGTFTYGLVNTGGTIAGTWENGQPAIVIGNDGRTIYNGFLSDTIAAPQLYANQFSFLLGAGQLATTGGIGGNGSGAGAGGAGMGGSASLTALGGQLELNGRLSLYVESRGGSGAVGGDATAGSALVNITDGATVTGGGSLVVGSIARGGAGTVSGGTGTGGIAQVDLTGGASMDIGGLAIDASGSGGSGPEGEEGEGVAGEAIFNITGADAALGRLSMKALGTPHGVPVTIDFDQATLDVSGDARFESGGDISVEIANSTVDIGGELALIAAGSLAPEIDDATTDITVGSVLGRIGGDVTIEAIEAVGTIDIVAGGLIAAGSVAGGGIILRAGGSLTAETLLSSGSIIASSETSFVDIGTAIAGVSPPPETTPEGGATTAEVGSGGFIRIDAATDATIDSGTATGGIGILARSGSIEAGPLQAGRSIVLLAGETIDLETVQAGTGTDDYVFLASSEMISSFGEAFEAAALGGVAPVPVTGRIHLNDTVTAGNLVAAAQGNFTAEGAIDAGHLLDVRAGGFADFQALATATNIRVRSSDIGFGSGDVGGLGDSSTQAIILTVAPNVEAIFIGGDGADSGYRLQSSEVGQLKAASITVETSAGEGGPPATVNVGTATVNGSAAGESANITSEEGSFRIRTSGDIQVNGDFRIASAGAGNQLALEAGDRIQVLTPTGSLRVLDAAGNPTGSLSLQASNIWVTDPTIADQLAADVDFSGRDEALRENGGENRPRGAIEAGGVTITVTESLFVQNTGTRRDPAGITVGDGGLTVRSSNSEGATQVLAFGRRLSPDGSFTSGSAFFQEAAFETQEAATSAFSDDSRFNNCVINTGACAADDNPVVGRTTSSSSIVGSLGEDDGAVEDAGEEGGGGGGGQMSTQLVDTSALEAEPIFEEPVTSGGDVNLWWDDDEDDDDEDDEDGEDEDEDEDEEEGENGND